MSENADEVPKPPQDELAKEKEAQDPAKVTCEFLDGVDPLDFSLR